MEMLPFSRCNTSTLLISEIKSLKVIPSKIDLDGEKDSEMGLIDRNLFLS